MYKKYVSGDKQGNVMSYNVAEINTSKETDDWSGEKLADYRFIEVNLKGLSGRILTIVDASIPEGKQNKCVKDLVRKEFLNEFSKIADLLYDKKEMDRCVEEVGEYELVSAKEILE